MSRTKSPLKWRGSKRRMLRHLLPLVNATPHVLYAEAFAGGLSLLLAKEPSKAEVVNDLHRDLIAFWRNLKAHPDELIREIECVPISRATLKDYMEERGLTEIQRAARWFVRGISSFSASYTSFAVSRRPGGGPYLSRAGAVESIRAANVRMDRVAIECLPWERFLALYDSPDTLFFLDPPYVCPDIGVYASFTQADMDAFAARVLALRGPWIVTINDSPANRAAFPGCHITATEVASGAAKSTTGARLREIIITPFAPP